MDRLPAAFVTEFLRAFGNDHTIMHAGASTQKMKRKISSNAYKKGFVKKPKHPHQTGQTPL